MIRDYKNTVKSLNKFHKDIEHVVESTDNIEMSAKNGVLRLKKYESSINNLSQKSCGNKRTLRFENTKTDTQKSEPRPKVKSFKFEMPKIKLPTISSKALKRIPVILLPIVFIVVSYFMIPAIFANQTKVSQYDKVSYIGNQKIMEDYAAITNTKAMGGNEIKLAEANNTELKFFFYKVKQGETLFTISQKLGMSMDTLISLNTMDNAHVISVGQKIIVPNLQGILYNVKAGDTLASIAKTYKIDVKDILDANDIEDETISVGMLLFLPGARLTDEERAKVLGYMFIKPMRGRFTSGFGIRTDPFTGGVGYHTGIDIAGYTGQPVLAAKEGTVTYAGWHGGHGIKVVVKHQFGYDTVYSHLSALSVKVGQYVKAGQMVGKCGSTGRSTGPHLHFEVHKFGRPVNPVRVSGLAKNGSMY